MNIFLFALRSSQSFILFNRAESICFFMVDCATRNHCEANNDFAVSVVCVGDGDRVFSIALKALTDSPVPKNPIRALFCPVCGHGEWSTAVDVEES